MKVVFLSHAPHEAHQSFAASVSAKTHILPFMWYIRLTKRWPLLSYGYPLLSVLYSFCIRTDADVILADGGSSLYAAAATAWRRKRAKLILLDADLLFYNFYTAHGAHVSLIQRIFFSRIDGVVSVSEHNASYTRRVLSTVPIAVCRPYPKTIPPGIDSERKNTALYVGRLDPEKRIDRVINAALSCRHIEELVIVGDGTLRTSVERMAATHKKIRYVPATPTVAPYYQSSMFFIHLPDHDPYPTATLEAVQGGCIPLISRGVGTTDVLDPLFVIEDPDNVESIGARVAAILANKESARELLSKSSSRVVRKDASVQNFAASFRALVSSIE